MLLAAWVSAAVALDSSSMSAGGLSSTRTAFLIIAVLAFVESLTILILSLVEIINEIVVSRVLSIESNLTMIL